METIDFRKDTTYKANTQPAIITVPKMRFVMVDGHGGPEASDQSETEFQKAMKALFGIVYTIKFWDKKYDPPKGYAKFNMAPVEGLWWSGSGDGKDFDMTRPGDWRWTVMLRVPDFVTPEFFSQVVDECINSKHDDVYRNARLEDYDEGLAVQIMHIGPYNQEAPNINKMHQFAFDNGYELVGRHHELYFGDPRRSAPEKLRTILRQPIKLVKA